MRIKLVNLFITAFLIFANACSTVKYVEKTKRADKRALNQFLKELPEVAKNQHYTVLMDYIDEDYIKTQHDDFLKGDDLQFVNELFCGNSIKDNSFHCINQNEITQFDIIEVNQLNSTSYQIKIHVGDGMHTILSQLKIVKKIKNDKPKYGLVGAVG
jgi:hypothetical protein